MYVYSGTQNNSLLYNFSYTVAYSHTLTTALLNQRWNHYTLGRKCVFPVNLEPVPKPFPPLASRALHVWITEHMFLRPLSTAWLVPKATQCLCEEPSQSPYSLRLYIFFSQRAHRGSLPPSVFLRDSSVFLIPALSDCAKGGRWFTVIFVIIYEWREVLTLPPDFEFSQQVWVRWNPRSSDLEAHTVLAGVQMLFEMQDLKGCLLPCSILPQTAPVKSGISGKCGNSER